MDFNLKDYLRGPYASYNVVQLTNILLGVAIIRNWPNLNVAEFWVALAAYAVAFAVSITIYARYRMCESPVRVAILLGISVLFVFIATVLRQDWWTWTGMSLIAPLAAIVWISGILYNWVLGTVRTWLFPFGPRKTRRFFSRT